MTRVQWLKNLTFKKMLVETFIFCILLVFMPIAKADIAVIVNSANSGVSLKRSDVQAIFLGMQTKLPNGSTIVPFDQGNDQKIRQQFYELIASKNAVEMKTYWSRLNFTGRAVPPTVLGSASAVRAKVAGDKNAIGYVDSALTKGASDVSVALLIPTN